jgi:hypothetical protein
VTTFKFYLAWFRLGRAYWKARHVFVLKAWLDSLDPQLGVGDEVEAWLADQPTNRDES